VVSDLKASSERVGRLYPVLLDRHGNIIDGQLSVLNSLTALTAVKHLKRITMKTS